MSGRANAVYRVMIEVSPEAEQAWSRWFTEEHVAAVLRQPGFLGATRWKDVEPAPDGWARYVVHYRSSSVEAIEAYRSSAEAARIRDDHTSRFGNVTRLSRSVLAEPTFVAPGG
ncbi:MAG TPA: DUF4286 family protein [Myxococcaceae bacterium]|nr:DUF4286 family protein [Myxococcaceae bacterium]